MVEGTKKLSRTVADLSDQINIDREMPQVLVNQMSDQGFFRLLVPKSVGGLEISHPDFLEIVFEIAKADGSVAWCLNQNNVLGTLAAFMPQSLANSIWTDTNSVLSNGPPKSTNLSVTKGGYRLSGRWDFSSGIRHANWVIAVAKMGEKPSLSESGVLRHMVVPKDSVKLIDSWEVSGLRGTGSFSFEIEDAFIPENYCFVETKSPIEEGPLYHIPRSLLFSSGFATVALGVARSGLNSVKELSRSKEPQEQAMLMEQVTTQRDIGMAEAIWKSCFAYLKESTEAMWESVSEERAIPLERRIDLRLASTHAIREAVRVIQIAYGLCGSSAIFQQTRIQRCFQDVNAISQQIQGRMSHYETAGQHFLGNEPDSRFH